jgi:drug/metabolite transporter (DMT)-like permease
MFTFYQAISYLGVALGVIIQFTHPLLIILFGAAVLGERITWIAVVAVTCIMVGVILIVQVFEAGSDAGERYRSGLGSHLGCCECRLSASRPLRAK